MAHPLRFQMRRTKGWRKPDGGVCCARPSGWGNPFQVDHTTIVPAAWLCVHDGSEDVSVSPATTEQAVALYRLYILSEVMEEAGHGVDLLAELRGRPLGCYCPLQRDGKHVPCHVDVLCELANS